MKHFRFYSATAIFLTTYIASGFSMAKIHDEMPDQIRLPLKPIKQPGKIPRKPASPLYVCYNPQISMLSLDYGEFCTNATINIESSDLNTSLSYNGVPVNINLTPGIIYHISAIFDNGQIYCGELVYL